ncbi:MAG: diaminobutyrate--2-oxoglutarate transaminase family protein [Spirochaetes bacterium]|uniref:Diaminobutyrate--2-oxoglutarate transaminase family protein n=1 Tax=Candidatus Aphodenecus pullistercoris TaxID=2840669 RepID=A0A9D9E7T7_9SPIR|nr:diaminobutyrate--2-oxoglutarate transaminase family protein [Candidatus Aphodenecus pullistercoris]
MNEAKLTNKYFIDRQSDFESSARSYPRKFPFALKKAKGSWVEDVEGNRYLDFLCGAGTLALGHNDDEVNAAMVELIQSGSPLHTLDLTTPVKDRFVQTILDHLPGTLKDNAKIQFCSPSGTDATDAAIKLCKTATGRSTVIAFHGAFHGMGHGALSLTGNLAAKTPVANLMPGVQFMPYPNSYRCPFGLGGEAGAQACSAYFERMLKDPESGVTKPAAVILEAIQGEGGVIPAPASFLQTVRRVTAELDIPLICDEIQCGMGRSGRLFAFEHAGITPDVILASKAIGGSQPMAVVIYDRKLDKWAAGAHTGTFRGNQLAMAAGTVVLNRVSNPAFLVEVTRKGDRLKAELEKLKDEVSIIGDVRGTGLMLGVEFIDPNGKVDIMGHPEPSGEIAARIQHLCFEDHLVMEKGGRNGSVMRCLCALTVSDEEIDTMLSIFGKAVRKVDGDVTKA